MNASLTIKRDGFECTIPDIPFKHINVYRRALSDAVDILLPIINDDKPISNNITINMTELRKHTLTKGNEAEEALMLSFLKGIGYTKGIKINGGFRMKKNGDVADRSKIHLFISHAS